MVNMRSLKSLSLAVLLLGGTFSLSAATIEEDFTQPPAAAKPMVWWHWIGNNVSKEGITQDLEAMQAAGFGGATIFNVGWPQDADNNPAWAGNEYRSPAWWTLVEHAAKEADRLDLNLGMHNCVGYSASGGPWITPERSMKEVVWTTTPIEGGTVFTGILPPPKAKLDFYRDIAVVALPDGNETGSKDAVDISKFMKADGTLEWEAPAGSWSVYRFGYPS